MDVLVSDHVVDQFHSARKQFLQAVMDNLGTRFPEMELVDSFSVFDPRNLAKLGDEQIDRYGIHQVDVLTRHFSKEQTIEGQGAQPGLIDYDTAVSEWILLRSLMSRAYRGMNCEFVSSLLTLAKHADVFPALCVVASAVAALSVTKASPEREFSTQNRIFTAAEPTFGRNPRPAHENFYRRPVEQPDGLSQGFAAVAISANNKTWTSALTENCPLRLSAYV